MWVRFCEWSRFHDFTPTSAIAWVDSQFHDRSESFRADMVHVWCALAYEIKDFLGKQVPPPIEGEASGDGVVVIE